MFTVDIQVTGDMFPLLKEKKKVPGAAKSELRPVLHRVAANICNAALGRAQDALATAIEENFINRIPARGVAGSKGARARMKYFLQEQILIPKVVSARDYPNIEGCIEINPRPYKSERASDIPILLEMFDDDRKREPFKGIRWAWPNPETTREGGTFSGRILDQYRWDKLGLHRTTITRETSQVKPKNAREAVAKAIKSKNKSISLIEGKDGIFMHKKGNRFYVLQRKDKQQQSELIKQGKVPPPTLEREKQKPGTGKGGKQPYTISEPYELLYVLDPIGNPWWMGSKRFSFFGISFGILQPSVVQNDFNELLANDGLLDGNFIKSFKYYSFGK